MKILLVEDDNNKLKQLGDFIAREKPEATIEIRKSYQSGLSAVLDGSSDLVLLDMSMPTYDQSPTEGGGRKRHFAGREILRKMNRKCVISPVVIITQFTRFGEDGAISLEEVTEELDALGYENYLGTVFYSAEAANWQETLRHILNRFD
ncbi:MAG: response regulator [Verrucomicrobiota bacterium]